MATRVKYTHLPLGKDVEAFAGYYTPQKEATLKYDGRDVLYVTGHIVIEATCLGDSCNLTNEWYALIPGYLLKWQNERNEAGLPVSEVELISDRETQDDIKQIILESEAVSRVDFW